MNLEEFKNKYPNDDICLEVLFRAKFGEIEECPKCHRETKFYRVRKRKCFACMRCGGQIHPMANTIFRKTTAPLTVWFYLIYMFATTKTGVSAMEVQRVTGYTYKKSWRTCKLIREAMQLPKHSAEDSVHLRTQFTKSIKATHNQISDKYFQYYLAEFIFRYQYRTSVIPDKMIKKIFSYEPKPE